MLCQIICFRISLGNFDYMIWICMLVYVIGITANAATKQYDLDGNRANENVLNDTLNIKT